MLVVVPHAHTNILLGTATQCCLMGFSAMANVAIAGMAVVYIRPTGKHLLAILLVQPHLLLCPDGQ